MVIGGILRLTISPWAMRDLALGGQVELLDHAIGLRQVAFMGLGGTGEGEQHCQDGKQASKVFHGESPG
jgi:hypothetical protein